MSSSDSDQPINFLQEQDLVAARIMLLHATTEEVGSQPDPHYELRCVNSREVTSLQRRLGLGL